MLLESKRKKRRQKSKLYFFANPRQSLDMLNHDLIPASNGPLGTGPICPTVGGGDATSAVSGGTGGVGMGEDLDDINYIELN